MAIQALATPLFPSELAGGAPAPTISLEGVVNFPGRTAALLSIAGAPAQWLTLGDEKDGVLLEAVDGAKVRVATVAGSLDLVIADAPVGAIAVGPETPQ